MAEYCLECWNRINGLNESEDEYIISKGYALCEGCGEFKRIIIAGRKEYYRYRLKRIFFPLYIIWRIILIPRTLYLFHKYKKEISKNKDV